MKIEEETFPTAIFCIILYEFCERFSFCGLRTILSLFLKNELLFSENGSTTIYHVFNMACHAVPLLGAYCADSFLGRYRTILYSTSLYMIGNIMLCATSIPTLNIPKRKIGLSSLALMAIGSGALKPCVAAFGGDQFKLPDQQRMLRHFFSLFYFTINLGGFLGMMVTPVLRKWVTCFGGDTCYALGFGLPALFIVLGFVVLLLGRIWYRLRSPKGPVMKKFISCTWNAIVSRKLHKVPGKTLPHWLDYASGDFSIKLIYDMKIVYAILLLYVLLPLFWSLFDQQGSRWTFQASHMNGRVLGIQIVPDQMQVLNPLMVLFLIPVFDRIVYPLCERMCYLANPLDRMTIGGLTAGFAFLIAGVLELNLKSTHLKSQDSQLHMSLINTLPCSVQLGTPFGKSHYIAPGKALSMKNNDYFNISRERTSYIRLTAPTRCGKNEFQRTEFQIPLPVQPQEQSIFLIGINSDKQLQIYICHVEKDSDRQTGKFQFRIMYIKTSTYLHRISITLKNTATGLGETHYIPDVPLSHVNNYAYKELPQGTIKCIIRYEDGVKLHEKTLSLSQDGTYVYVIREDLTGIEFAELYAITTPNKISILWLLPQYLLISIAEIMFGIAGLEFSFTQAPKSMKTIIIAGWYMSVAIGNFIVIIVTQARFFRNQANEFFLFSVLIVGDMMLFTQMSSNYKFVTLEADSSVTSLNRGSNMSDNYDITDRQN